MFELYNKKLFPTRTDRYGNEKFASRTHKHYITTKKLYDAKGKFLFRIEVTSFKRYKKRIKIEGTTIQNVSVEVPNVSRNLRRAIETAKIKAKAGHYSDENYDMTTFSPTLIERFVNFRLIDYIIRYERIYSERLKKPLLTYKSKVSKRKVGRRIIKKRYNIVYRYYQVTNKQRIESKIEAQSLNQIKKTLSDYDLDINARKGSYYKGGEANI